MMHPNAASDPNGPRFPGSEYAVERQLPGIGTAYEWEEGTVQYGRTTDGQWVVLPDTVYWVRTELTGYEPRHDPSSYIPETFLSVDQRDAIGKASLLQNRRSTGAVRQNPEVAGSSRSLQEVYVDTERNLYVGHFSDSDDGTNFATPAFYARLQSLQPAGDIVFATPVAGHYGVFRYFRDDITAFAELNDVNGANAYYRMDMPRLTRPDGQEYHLARFRLFQAEVAVDFPLIPAATVAIVARDLPPSAPR